MSIPHLAINVKMWIPIAVLVAVTAIASGEYGFKVGTEYIYEVNSRTLTSLQQVSQQYSGLHIRARVTIKTIKEDELIAHITQPESAQIHTTFPGGVGFDFPQDAIQYSSLTLNKQPFIVKLKDGLIDELVVSKELSIWEVNIIRSIVSQLQVDTQGKRVIPSKLNSIPRGDENTAVYKIMEDTVEGECEVLYDITPLPKYILQRMPHLAPQPQLAGQGQIIDIMKTKNFSNCEQRPGYHFGLTGLTDWEPTTNKMGNFLSRSSVSRVIVSGSLKSYTIQSSVTTNKVILSPEVYNNQKGEVVSRVNLTLISVHSAAGEVQGPKNPQVLKKLVYDYNSPWTTDSEAREKWDKRKEKTFYKATSSSGRFILEQLRNRRSVDDKTLILSNEGWYPEMPKMTEAPETPFLPYFIGYSGHSIQHSKEVNVNHVVRKLTEQIGQYLQDQTKIYRDNILERFSILTGIIRTMNVKQLEECVQEIYTPEQENIQEVSSTRRNAWMTFRDALAQAGTGPVLLTIVNLITTKKIKTEEAAQVVSVLPETVRYPTTDYLNTFFELIKKQAVVSEDRLNTSSIYAFTKLVRLTRVNQKAAHNRYPVHAFGYFAPHDDTTVTDVYIPYFAKRLEDAVKERDSHKIQIYITALGNIAHPKIVQIFEPYLEGKKPMTIFQRTLVVVSLNKLATVHPRLARSVFYKTYANIGESYQVRVAAVYNLMKTNPSGIMLQRMAQFTHEDPSYQVRAAVKSAIESAALLLSKTNHELRENAQSAVNMLVPSVFGIQYSRSNLTDYLVKGLHLEYTQIFEYIGSEDSLIPKYVLYRVVGNQNGFINTIYKVTGMMSSVRNMVDLFRDIFVSVEKEPAIKDFKNKDETLTIEKIRKILNIEELVTEQVEGNILFKFGTIQRFFTFDNHTLKSLPQMVHKLSKMLSKGKVYNYQKMSSDCGITLGLPTATGLPFVYTLKTPTYIGVKGKVQAELAETEKSYKFPKTAQLSVNVDMTFGKTRQGEMGFVTPFDHQRFVAGYKRQLQTNIPIKGSLSLDSTKNKIQMEIKPVEKRGDYKFIHYSTKPYTAIQKVVDFKPVVESGDFKVITSKVPKEIIQHYGEKQFGVVVRLQGRTEKRNVELKKIIYDIIKRNDITVFYPVEISIDNTEVGLYYDTKMSTAQAVSLTATYQQLRSKDYQREESEPEKVFISTQDGQSRTEEFYRKVSTGINRAVVSVVDIALKVQGQTPIQYVGTFAFARSPVDAPTKVLAYLHKATGNEGFEICFNGKVKDHYLSAVDFEKVFQAEPQSEVTAELKFGEKCESGAKIDFSGKLERTEKRREYLQIMPQVLQCRNELRHGNKLMSGCRNATMVAGLMDKYRFTVHYHGVPDQVKNMTYQVYSILRHIGYPYVTESLAPQERQSERIELDVEFSPDLKAVDVYVSAPTGVAHFRNIPVSKYARTVFVIHPIYHIFKRLGWSSLQQQYDAYCTIDKVQAKTFDNQTYPAHLGNVWHVMSISVPMVKPEGKHKSLHDFSVLVRETSGSQKEVQFVFDYPRSTIVRVAPYQGKQPNFYVNEKQVYFDDNGYYEYHDQFQRSTIQAYVMPTGELKIVHLDHGIEFIYDQDRVQLVLSQEYRNRVGGLCGVFNGEHFNYVTPQGYILRDPEEFAATWALSSEGRIGELKKKAQEHSMYAKEIILTNVVSGQDTGKADTLGRYHEDGLGQEYDPYGLGSEESQGHDSQCITKRIIAIERHGKHCFSVHPQTTCKNGCQVEKTKTMSAEFICVNKTQTSSHWAQMVARGAQPNFKNKGNAQKMHFEGPEVCNKA